MNSFFVSCAEKAESLLGTAEDKETTEQESRKPPEQEVGPFPPCPLTAAFVSIPLLLSCMSSHASSHLQPPLVVLQRPLLSNLDTSFQQPFSPSSSLLLLLSSPSPQPPSVSLSLRRPPALIRRLRPRGRLTVTRARQALKTKRGRIGAERRRPPQRRRRLPTRGSRL